MKKIIVFVGPPNGGKGSAIREMKQKLSQSLRVISSGDLLRELAKSNKEVEHYITTGQLVPNNVIMPLACKEIVSAEEEIIILDGFPRTTAQAKTFLELCKNEFVVCIELLCSDKVCLERAQVRRICKHCNEPQRANETNDCIICGQKDALEIRADDANIVKRLTTFREETQEITDIFASVTEVLRIGTSDGINESQIQAMTDFAEGKEVIDRFFP